MAKPEHNVERQVGLWCKSRNDATTHDAEALETAQTVEAAEKDTQQLKSSAATTSTSSTQEVHRTSTAPRRHRPARTRREPTSEVSTTCHRCGGPHLATTCKFKEAVCYACRKRGHIARVCRSKSGNYQSQQSSRRAHYVQEDPDSKEDHAYTMFTFKDPAAEPICQEVSINNVPIKMEVDTGASVSWSPKKPIRSYREWTHTTAATFRGQAEDLHWGNHRSPGTATSGGQIW